jgi:hypothetical protein
MGKLLEDYRNELDALTNDETLLKFEIMEFPLIQAIAAFKEP